MATLDLGPKNSFLEIPSLTWIGVWTVRCGLKVAHSALKYILAPESACVMVNNEHKAWGTENNQTLFLYFPCKLLNKAFFMLNSCCALIIFARAEKHPNVNIGFRSHSCLLLIRDSKLSAEPTLQSDEAAWVRIEEDEWCWNIEHHFDARTVCRSELDLPLNQRALLKYHLC